MALRAVRRVSARYNGVDRQADASRPVLSARGVYAGYGSVPTIDDVSLDVSAGEIVVILGANGAGKTTTLRALTGVIPLMKGSVELLGDARPTPLFRRCRAGLGYVTEPRPLIASLSVADNLKLGGTDHAAAVELMPELRALLKRRAGDLSGGEQQILCLARALARSPRVLLADELSLGLAPLVVARLFEAIRRAADTGVGVLIVEQQLRAALSIADRVLVLRQGRLVLETTAADLRSRESQIQELYLSAGQGER